MKETAPFPAPKLGTSPAGRDFTLGRRGLVLGGLLLLVAALLWLTGALALLFQFLLLRLFPPAEGVAHLHLEDYVLAAPPVTIEGIEDNLSGLTYCHSCGTLLATVNRPQEVLEITREGGLLRRITVRGVKDLEGITHVEGTDYILVDEGTNRLHWVTITPETREIDVSGGDFVQLDPARFHNMGFEALSWDHASQTLWVGQEMWPIKVIKIEGLTAARDGGGLGVSVTHWRPKGIFSGAFMDLSSMTLHEKSGNLLLLSDLTSAVAEFDAEGAPLGLLPLWSGFSGLESGVPQAEGVAMDDDERLYVISEPNLLYRLERASPQQDVAGSNH